MALRIETQSEPIPGYRLLERLGAGGFGEVWKAEAPGGLLKAIKIVRGDGRSEGDGGGLASQELKALRRVQSVRHPYLLSIDRYDVIDGHLLIVTELADGSLWDRWLACRNAGNAGLPRDSLLRYLNEAAEVLDLMHTKHRLQHLDIKPQNLFLIHDHIKVADFGLVKDLHGVQGVITGGVTPFYAAPETFNDVVSKHCDQYSLAIVYCELLTGRRPFAGGSAQMVMVQHLQVEPNLDALPNCDRAAVFRALSKSPRDRFRSCTEFVRSLGPDSSVVVAPIVECSPEEIGSADPPADADTRMRGADTESDGSCRTRPTVVLGLGGVGGAVLQRLHAALRDRGAEPARFRLLYVDTDADSLTEAQFGESGLTPCEVLHIPLRRPGHYLKPRRDGRRPIDGWVDGHVLNRLSRLTATQGVRALGRLAFVDHDRALNHALTEAVRPVKNSRGLSESLPPQVLVVCGLAGGTGGGICIDAAYLLQHVFQRLGEPAAKVHGWLLVPPIRRQSPAEVRACANALAALREIQHMSTGETCYDPIGMERASSDASAPPFDSLTILPLDTSGAVGQIDGIELTVQGIVRQVIGIKTSELAECASHAVRALELPFRTLGAVQFSWPRNAILVRAALRTGQALVGQWLQADSSQVRDAIQTWFADQWACRDLGPEKVSRRLEGLVSDALGQSPESVILELTRQFVAAKPSTPTSKSFHEWLIAIDDWVGRPPGAGYEATAGRFGDALLSAFREVSAEWSGRLYELVLSVMDVPGFRLAGADAAARAAIDAAGRMNLHFKPLSDQWLRQAADARGRIEELFARGDSSSECLELAQSYVHWRMHGMLVGRVAAVYQAAQSRLTEIFDELAVCRQQIEATHRLLQQSDAARRAADPTAEAAGWLLPEECRTIDDAANRVVHSISWSDAQELDHAIQSSVAKRLGGLARACLTTADAPQKFSAIIGTVARDCLTPRVDASGAADAFVSAYGGISAAAQVLANAVDAAAPLLGNAGSSESAAWELPPGHLSDQLAQTATIESQFEITQSTGPVDSITVIRERRVACITELPHFGRAACEAFDLVCRADGSTPHARFDIDEWLFAEPAIR